VKCIALTDVYHDTDDRVVKAGEPFEMEVAKAKSLIEIGAAKDAKVKDEAEKPATTKVTGEG
jgi:hypothetical protein